MSTTLSLTVADLVIPIYDVDAEGNYLVSPSQVSAAFAKIDRAVNPTILTRSLPKHWLHTPKWRLPSVLQAIFRANKRTVAQVEFMRMCVELLLPHVRGANFELSHMLHYLGVTKQGWEKNVAQVQRWLTYDRALDGVQGPLDPRLGLVMCLRAYGSTQSAVLFETLVRLLFPLVGYEEPQYEFSTSYFSAPYSLIAAARDLGTGVCSLEESAKLRADRDFRRTTWQERKLINIYDIPAIDLSLHTESIVDTTPVRRNSQFITGNESSTPVVAEKPKKVNRVVPGIVANSWDDIPYAEA